ncbi:DUF1217 domain-containing protein [Bosea sp. BK604]|uniref:DUF1217 domain-containing protein n=1 Tax=Bosea sp. BK604 TaxID=2512180 RepID=UPI00105138ED|nr:DUF1217 domain-containing protein [Bosea sp. BK604]TCR63655.1 uncharacterized protein DUF1217 [Bosea sp. BK604]
MISTTLAYQAVTRNLTQSLERTAEKPDVATETAYFEKNIGKVKTLDDFMADDRLYRYAVDAYGLGDMAYAKAFMRRVLEEGGNSPDSFASRLSDPRYRVFAAAFDFSGTEKQTQLFTDNIRTVNTVTFFVHNEGLFNYAMKAFGLESIKDKSDEIMSAMHAGKLTGSFGDKEIDAKFRDFLKVYDFAKNGTRTTFDPKLLQETTDRYQAAVRAEQMQPTVDRYVRQQFEENEGASNENVRLALYFSRKAPSLKNAFQVLADPALIQVVQTALGIPKETSGMDIDRQADLISKKLDFAKLQNPEELQKFLTRFTAMADAQAGPPMSAALTILVGPPASAAMTTDLLMSIQSLRLGGM